MVDLPESYAPPGGYGGKSGVQRLIEDYLAACRDEHGSGTDAASAESELNRWVE